MLKIGEFAWLSQVTVETLRHYDRLGLLEPAYLDASTGYRYYSPGQLPRLNRILVLKELGLALKEIAALLDKSVSNTELQQILKTRQTELEQQIEDAQRRLTRVKARMIQIDKEQSVPDYDVLIKTVNPQLIASMRESISSWDQDVVGPAMSRMFDEVMKHLKSQDAGDEGVGIALYHEQQFIHQGSRTEDIDVEAAVTLKSSIQESETVKLRQLAKTEVAYAVHYGSFTGLPLAKQAIYFWIEANGYSLAGPVRELYLAFDPEHENNSDSPLHVTEVQFPVEKS